MIKHSKGNAGKSSRRCPHCGFENALSAWGPMGKGERRIAHTCAQCGEWIVLDGAAWDELPGRYKIRREKGDEQHASD